MADIPHFDLPFRYLNAQPVVVEQDSEEDVLNCVEAIVRTPVGERPELPTFGSDDWLFSIQPIPTMALINSISEQEPRAMATVEQEPDAFEDLAAKVRISVTQLEEG